MTREMTREENPFGNHLALMRDTAWIREGCIYFCI